VVDLNFAIVPARKQSILGAGVCESCAFVFSPPNVHAMVGCKEFLVAMNQEYSPGTLVEDTSQPAPQIRLSIVIPTYNEMDNVLPLVQAIYQVLKSDDFEIIFVDDDSPDGTSSAVKSLAGVDRRVRCIRRVGRRGLSSAAIEGFLSSSATYVALMDGDLQHDEAILPQMLEQLDAGADISIASRYTQSAASGGFSDGNRQRLSNLGGLLANKVLKITATDPMSGFFMMRRDRFDATAPNLSVRGFKILADILASAPSPLKVSEVAYTFRERHAGDSKLDNAAMLDYLSLLLDKTVGRFIPLRFIIFSAVGGSGVVLHIAILALALKVFALPFMISQGLAALTAMSSNFLLNNYYTFADRRLRGKALLIGLVSFYIICSVGFLANVGVGDFLFGQGRDWWLAGLLGAVVGSVWNYAVSSVLTWRKK